MLIQLTEKRGAMLINTDYINEAIRYKKGETVSWKEGECTMTSFTFDSDMTVLITRDSRRRFVEETPEEIMKLQGKV